VGATRSGRADFLKWFCCGCGFDNFAFRESCLGCGCGRSEVRRSSQGQRARSQQLQKGPVESAGAAARQRQPAAVGGEATAAGRSEPVGSPAAPDGDEAGAIKDAQKAYDRVHALAVELGEPTLLALAKEKLDRVQVLRAAAAAKLSLPSQLQRAEGRARGAQDKVAAAEKGLGQAGEALKQAQKDFEVAGRRVAEAKENLKREEEFRKDVLAKAALDGAAVEDQLARSRALLGQIGALLAGNEAAAGLIAGLEACLPVRSEAFVLQQAGAGAGSGGAADHGCPDVDMEAAVLAPGAVDELIDSMSSAELAKMGGCSEAAKRAIVRHVVQSLAKKPKVG